MADPVDMIVPLLREMRAENAGLGEQTRKLIRTRERRLGAIEEAQNSCRQALTAASLPSKLVTGEVEERIEALRTQGARIGKPKVSDLGEREFANSEIPSDGRRTGTAH